MGGHGHEAYKVPDASTYKIEGIPKLEEVQNALRRQGLRDPWLRNEVWRYDAATMGTHASRARAFFGRGFVWGLGAFLVTIGIEAALGLNDHGHAGHINKHG